MARPAYKGSFSLKEAFNQVDAYTMLGGKKEDMGAGFCPSITAWWLEHIASNPSASFIFVSTAGSLKQSMINDAMAAATHTHLGVMVTRMRKVGFRSGTEYKETYGANNWDDLASDTAAGKCFVALVVSGARGAHVMGLGNAGGSLHMFDPNAGHYTAKSAKGLKQWISQATGHYDKQYQLDIHEAQSFSK